MADPQTVSLSKPEETSRLGGALAPFLRTGDTVLLSGPIGSGKTHFARAVIQQRLAENGRYEDVPSPTYTLVQTYDDTKVQIWHADLYRLTSSDEVLELGLEDAFETAIVLIEWPDRFASGLPETACHIEFEIGGDGRSVTIQWSDKRCSNWLASFWKAA